MKLALSVIGALGLILFAVTYRVEPVYEGDFRNYRGHLYVCNGLFREGTALVTLRATDLHEAKDLYWATFVGDRCTALKLGTPQTLIEEPALSNEAPVQYALRLVTEARSELASEQNRVRKSLQRLFPKWMRKIGYFFTSRSASAGGFFFGHML